VAVCGVVVFSLGIHYKLQDYKFLLAVMLAVSMCYFIIFSFDVRVCVQYFMTSCLLYQATELNNI
jgi:hypothetical protein